jgi:alpha-1,6-mannosyltransferase
MTVGSTPHATSLLGYRLSQALLVLVGLCSLLATRYSKVEESFQLQATHDLYYNGVYPAFQAFWSANTASGSDDSSSKAQSIYDHLQFPGVVPRSFVGPLLLSAQCRLLVGILHPFIRLVKATGIHGDDSTSSWEVPPYVVEYMARFFLLAWDWSGWFRLSRALNRRYTASSSSPSSTLPSLGTYLLLVTASQFHMVYYASRMLPNVFATVLTLHCFGAWVEDRIEQAAMLLVVATAVFRCDLVLLLFTVGLSWLICRQLTVTRAFVLGTVTGAACLAVTIPLDSMLWQKWTWPEGTVLYYNTVLNKSSDWGTSPWHWYWTSALPKALLLSLPMVPVSILHLPAAMNLLRNPSMLWRRSSSPWLSTTSSIFDPTWLRFVLPAFGYVALYSFLGHKEVRFLFPALPLFNLGAAIAMSKVHAMADIVYKDKPIHVVSKLLYVACAVALLLSLAASFVFVAVSRHNYPGGRALEALTSHVRDSSLTQVRVHVDVASAMTGVSKFAERQARYSTPGVNWTFTKSGYEAEHSAPSTTAMSSFTHLLSEDPNVDAFRILEAIQGNPRLDLKRLRIATSEAIYVLENDKLFQR